MNLEQLINVLGLLVWIAARAVSRVGPHGSGLVYRELHDFYGYLQLDLLGPVVAGNRSLERAGGPSQRDLRSAFRP